MDGTVLAVQMYTLRDFLKTPQDIAASMKKVREIGYKAVQISGLGPIEPTELKRITDGEGLTICATHQSWDLLRNEPEKVIEDHSIMDCKVTAIPSLPAEYRNEAGYHRFAKEASAVGERLAKDGITVAYHNHSFEFERFGTETGLGILFNESDPAHLAAELDTYWVQHGGADPIDWIRQMKGRLPVIHLKDMVIQDNKQIMAEVGEGNLNWPGIIEACKEVGVEWYIIEQDTCQRDPFESLAISLRNLQAMGLN